MRIGVSGGAEVRFEEQIRRSVAQPGSALAWGARGREFKSRRSDQYKTRVDKIVVAKSVAKLEKSRGVGLPKLEFPKLREPLR